MYLCEYAYTCIHVCVHVCMNVCFYVCVVLLQEYLLHNAMSIFTFVGSNLAQHDDVYSFQLITRTVDTVIPALITASIFRLGN